MQRADEKDMSLKRPSISVKSRQPKALRFVTNSGAPPPKRLVANLVDGVFERNMLTFFQTAYRRSMSDLSSPQDCLLGRTTELRDVQTEQGPMSWVRCRVRCSSVSYYKANLLRVGVCGNLNSTIYRIGRSREEEVLLAATRG